MDNILDKARAEGFYQDIILGDQTFSGWRNCSDRWELIRDYIADQSTVIDIGSHYGYFSYRIATEKNGCLVWSFEADKRRAEIQRLMLEHNATQNVILAEKRLTLDDFVTLSRVAEGIDYILCLSVIHYYPIEQIPNIIYLFSQIASKLIIEVPTAAESDVAEPETVKKLDIIARCLDLYYKKTALIGYASSPKDASAKRAFYRAENSRMLKKDVIPYIGGHYGRPHNLKFARTWKLENGKPWIKGLNVNNLLKMNLACPSAADILQRGAESYHLLMESGTVPTDIRPYNLIYTHDAVIPIDYEERTGLYENFDSYSEDVTSWTVEQFMTELGKHV